MMSDSTECPDEATINRWCDEFQNLYPRGSPANWLGFRVAKVADWRHSRKLISMLKVARDCNVNADMRKEITSVIAEFEEA